MIEKVVFMNMCMISDNKGNVLALDKVGKNYSGTTFPGGHVEAGETFIESVIREVFEETGLTIKNPKLMGIYHWISGDVRNVGFYTGQMSLKANLFHQMKEGCIGYRKKMI